MKYVLDASVAICWVIPRPLTPKAVWLRDEYQRQIHELLAPGVFIDNAMRFVAASELSTWTCTIWPTLTTSLGSLM